MIKIIKNNLIIDVCSKTILLRYLLELKRFVRTDKFSANAILGSDKNTTYHIKNTDYNFDEEIESVIYEEITEEEYKKLTTEIVAKTNNETESLKNEVNDLKKMINQQNELIEKLIARLN